MISVQKKNERECVEIREEIDRKKKQGYDDEYDRI